MKRLLVCLCLLFIVIFVGCAASGNSVRHSFCQPTTYANIKFFEYTPDTQFKIIGEIIVTGNILTSDKKMSEKAAILASEMGGDAVIWRGGNNLGDLNLNNNDNSLASTTGKALGASLFGRKIVKGTVIKFSN